MIALGAWLGVRSLKTLWRLLRPRPVSKIHALHAHHQHDARCGCGHTHLLGAQQIAEALSVKTQLLLVVSMGLRPCSGAIMMLLFSCVIGVYL